MNPVHLYLHYFFFNVYPYICLAVFLMGSLARFDRDQYTWKSDSSQLLRAGTLRWGSNLFHVGILFLFFGHLVGLLTPHWLYEPFISAAAQAELAIYCGRHRRAHLLRRPDPAAVPAHLRSAHPAHQPPHRPRDPDHPVGAAGPGPRSRCRSRTSTPDASTMLILADWAQRIVTFRPDADALVVVAWPFLIHMILGMTIFLLFPFSRLVHVWSGFATIAYLFRPYQVVRSRRLNVPAGHNLPRQARHLTEHGDDDRRRRSRPRRPVSTAWHCMRSMPCPLAGELRQRACTELLRQAAQRAGLLAADDAPSEDGVISEAAAERDRSAARAGAHHSRAVGGSLHAALRGATKRPIGPASACGQGTSCLP